MFKESEMMRQVREWRDQVAADWEGKDFDEILAELEDARTQFEAEREALRKAGPGAAS